MYGAVTYLFVIPLFSRGPWSCFLCLWFGNYPFVLFHSFFFLTRTSRLAPMARTLLGGLEHAMFKFFVVAGRLFLVFCVCLNFDDLAKQRRKIFGGVSEVGKNDFSAYFCRLFVFFLVFFSLLRSRATCFLHLIRIVEGEVIGEVRVHTVSTPEYGEKCAAIRAAVAQAKTQSPFQPLRHAQYPPKLRRIIWEDLQYTQMYEDWHASLQRKRAQQRSGGRGRLS